MSFQFSLRKSLVLSFRESLATSDVRSDGLSFGVSYALGGETSFGLSFRLSSERSSPRSFRASFPRRFPASFLRSSKESAERGTGSGSALVVQWSGGGMRSPKVEERRTGNDERRTNLAAGTGRSSQCHKLRTITLTLFQRERGLGTRLFAAVNRLPLTSPHSELCSPSMEGRSPPLAVFEWVERPECNSKAGVRSQSVRRLKQ